MSTSETGLLLLFLCSSVLITLCLNRPDPDDQHYIGISVLALDYLHTPLQLIPSEVFKSGYAFSSFNLIASALSYSTGIPILYSYYFVIPAFFSIIVILIHWKILTLLTGKGWIVGLIFFLIVMLAWGDDHRTHANFGFVRLFQGKACFVSIITPAIILYFLKFQEQFQKKYAVLLFFTIVAGIGFTPTGIIVGPLTIGVLFLANIKFDRERFKKNLPLALSIIIPLLLGLIIKFHLIGGLKSGVHTARGVQEHTTNYAMLQFVLGPGYRGLFALFCFVISPFFVKNKQVKKGYMNFVIVCVLLLVIPWTSEFLAHLTYPTISWRWLWVLPLPLAMCIVTGSISEFFRNRAKALYGYIVITVLSVIFVASSERLVISEENYTTFHWPAFKLRNQEKIYLRPYGEHGIIQNGYIFMETSKKSF